MQSFFSLVLRGVAMGMAEVVPGVSGGTIAFITGIYDRLIDAIKSFDAGLWKTWKRGGFSAVWKAMDGNFLVTLLAGMGLGIIIGVFVVSYLLDNYPIPLWSFFFGLILASIWYVGRKLNLSFHNLLFFLTGALIALLIVMGVPSQGNDALWFVFFSGALAVSALMLPGISGSFILLLLGMYSYVLPKAKSFLSSPSLEDFQVLAVFGLGMLSGVIAFSHLLSYLLHHYHEKVYALLTGFMLGSLYKIWPWQQLVPFSEREGHATEVFVSFPVWPSAFSGEPMLIWALLSMFLGVALVLLISRKDNHTAV